MSVVTPTDLLRKNNVIENAAFSKIKIGATCKKTLEFVKDDFKNGISTNAKDLVKHSLSEDVKATATDSVPKKNANQFAF